jgi:hypothetical protein
LDNFSSIFCCSCCRLGGPPRLPSVDCVLRTRCDGISPAAQMVESADSASACLGCNPSALLNRPRPQNSSDNRSACYCTKGKRTEQTTSWCPESFCLVPRTLT